MKWLRRAATPKARHRDRRSGARERFRRALIERLDLRLLMHGGQTGTDPYYDPYADGELAPMLPSEASPVVDSLPGGNGAGMGVPSIPYTTLANGMPILNSRPGAGGTIFLDFDGDTATSTTAYDEDGLTTTFSTTEQIHIVEAWRQIVRYFAMFDVNVTTIQPNVSTTPTAWDAIGNNIVGGYSFVGVYGNSTASSHNQSSDARTRQSGITHEYGHNFGLQHQSTYDALGNKTAEYSTNIDSGHGVIMGIDFNGVVKKWFIGHPSNSVSAVQDDIAVIANAIKTKAAAGYTGDGFAPDDFGNTTGAASALPAVGTGWATTGVIERMTDADAFSFTASADGTYSFLAARDNPSGVDLKMSIYDNLGNLVAAQDGDPNDYTSALNNDQHITLDLHAGTYYVVVQSHGNYGDLGQYLISVNPMLSGWQTRDVGLNTTSGYSSYDTTSSTMSVVGSGSDIGSTADGFQYVYETLTGDGSITARVASMDSTSTLAKAGLMIRDTLVTGAKEVMVGMTSGFGVDLLSRATTGGSTTAVVGSAVTFAATWLRLVRSGSTFTAYRSADGISWTQYSTSVTVSMGQTVYIGLAVTANNTALLNAGQFTNLTLTGSINATATTNALANPGGLAVTSTGSTTVAVAWNDVSGETGYTIERSTDGVHFATVTTVAANTTTYTDTGLYSGERFFYRVRANDASGVSVPSNIANGITRAGVATGLNIISVNATQLVLNWTDTSGETGYRVERSADGSTGWTAIATVGSNVPTYTNNSLTTNTKYFYRVVTLDAAGDIATSSVVSSATRFSAVTGLTMATVASTQMVISWNANALANQYQVERSTDGTTYSNYALVTSGTTYTDNSITPIRQYYYRVVGLNTTTGAVGIEPNAVFAASPPTTPLPSPWLSQDIGTVQGPGTASFASGTYTVLTSGATIGSTSDSFRLAYQLLGGDSSITARVASLTTTIPGSTTIAAAGVMIRESLAANSRYLFVRAYNSNVSSSTAQMGIAFEYRSSTGGSVTTGGTATGTVPMYVKISRSNNTFTAQYSSDGVNWTTLGTVNMTLSGTLFVGLADRSDTSAHLNQATFTNVSTTGSSTVPVTAGLPNTQILVNSGSTTVNLWNAFSDPNNSDNQLTFTVVGNSNPSLVASVVPNNSTGMLTVNYVAGQLGSSMITVRCTNTTSGFVETTFTVYVVDAVNDAPVITAPTAVPTLIDTAIEFVSTAGSAISVYDSDNNIDFASQLTLHTTHGHIDLTSVAGLTNVTGLDSDTIVATGPLSALNAVLQDVFFEPDAGFRGVAQLFITVNDLGNAGSGGAKQSTTIVQMPVRALAIPTLLTDINTFGASSTPTSFATLGNIMYFLAADFVHGTELWRSDGTTAGTWIVKDLYAGISSGASGTLVEMNGRLYFAGNNGSTGLELWSTDGTDAGTTLVADIYSGVTSSAPTNLININGTLYFSALASGTGIELFKSDGTAIDTAIVKDIQSGSGSSSPANLRNVNGTLFFTATDGSTGVELWKSDGSLNGTSLVADIVAGSASTTPTLLTAVGSRLYFVANDGTNGSELWSTDGTTTAMVKNIAAGSTSSSPANLINYNGTLFFTANDVTNGNELWSSDGTTTAIVKNIASGSSSSSPANLTIVNGMLFFSANDSTNGTELWRTDSPTSLPLVMNIVAGSSSSSPANLTNVSGTLYFSATDSTNGRELWKTDGTTTQLVRDIVPGSTGSTFANFAALGSLLFFSDTIANEIEPWVSNGSAGGTFQLADINPGTASSTPGAIGNLNGLALFSASDITRGIELWQSAGPTAGASLLADIASTTSSSTPANFVTIGNLTYFTAFDATRGTELWKTDGTASGTGLVMDINPGSASSSPASLKNVGGVLFFTATDGVHGTELWKSDANGTNMVADSVVGTGSLTSVGNFTDVGGVLYFTASDGTNGTEVWKSDGTTVGMVKDILAGSGSSSPSALVSFNGRLYFSATDGTNGQELWSSNGTAAGTTMFLDIYAGSSSSSPASLTVMNGALYFAATDPTNSRELWKSDGTTAGTAMLRDLYPGTNASSPSNLAVVGNLLYFTATTATDGSELWRSDGTAAGTIELLDIYPGTTGSSAGLLTDIGGLAYFIANDGTHGVELWRSDGSPQGTALVADILAGLPDASISLLTNVGGSLYFRAIDGSHGSEMWVVAANRARTTTGVNTVTVTVGTAPAFDLAAHFADDSDQADGLLYSIVGNTNPALFSSLAIDPETGLLTLAASALGSSSLTIRAVDSGGLQTETTFTVVTNAAPRVAGVYVAGSVWAGAYTSFLDAQGYSAVATTGASGQGYAVPGGANQYKSLTWTNLDIVRIAFDEDVHITSAALSLQAATGQQPELLVFGYDSDHHIASWTFKKTFGLNAYLLTLDNGLVTDDDNGSLDGDWQDQSDTFAYQGGTGSGLGSSGTDFNFHFYTLPGDMQGFGTVLSSSAIQVRNALGKSTTDQTYNYRADVRGLGTVLSNAFIAVRNALGSSTGELSMPQPPPNHASAPSLAVEAGSEPLDESAAPATDSPPMLAGSVPDLVLSSGESAAAVSLEVARAEPVGEGLPAVAPKVSPMPVTAAVSQTVLATATSTVEKVGSSPSVARVAAATVTMADMAATTAAPSNVAVPGAASDMLAARYPLVLPAVSPASATATARAADQVFAVQDFANHVSADERFDAVLSRLARETLWSHWPDARPIVNRLRELSAHLG